MPNPTTSTAPRAPARPTTLTAHGDDRVDPWFWLRDRENAEVIEYLEAENEFTTAALSHTEELQQKLYDELVARIQETDLSAPVRKGDWWYYSRTVEGLQYGINCRKFGDLEADEQVLLDQNAEAEGHEFFSVGVFDISPDHMLLAYATDTTGGEKYTLRFRDLETGADLDDVIEGVYYGSAWSTDNRTFFYIRPDDAMRPYQVWRHELGTRRRRRAGVPGGRRALLPRRQPREGRADRDRSTPAARSPTSSGTCRPTSPPPTSRVIQPRVQGLEYAPTITATGSSSSPTTKR